MIENHYTLIVRVIRFARLSAPAIIRAAQSARPASLETRYFVRFNMCVLIIFYSFLVECKKRRFERDRALTRDNNIVICYFKLFKFFSERTKLIPSENSSLSFFLRFVSNITVDKKTLGQDVGVDFARTLPIKSRLVNSFREPPKRVGERAKNDYLRATSRRPGPWSIEIALRI